MQVPLYRVSLSLCSALPGQKIQRSWGRHSGSRAGLGWSRCGNSVAVDVHAEILAGENDRAVVGKCHVEALGVFDAALECRRQPAVGREQSRVEVVVVIGDQDAAHGVDADADGIVCDTLAADLPQKCAVVAKHLFQTWTNGTC